jgi:hypothetical protein
LSKWIECVNNTNFKHIDAGMTFNANTDQTNARFGVSTSARENWNEGKVGLHVMTHSTDSIQSA